MTTENKTPHSDIVAELNRLGENLGNLVRGAINGEERRSIEREIAAGLEQMNKKFADASDSLRTDAYVNQARKAVKEAWETARGPQILTELHQGVIDSLKRINEDLSKRSAPAQEATVDSVARDAKPD